VFAGAKKREKNQLFGFLVFEAVEQES